MAKEKKREKRAMLAVQLRFHSWLKNEANRRDMKIKGATDRIAEKVMAGDPAFYLG